MNEIIKDLEDLVKDWKTDELVEDEFDEGILLGYTSAADDLLALIEHYKIKYARVSQ